MDYRSISKIVLFANNCFGLWYDNMNCCWWHKINNLCINNDCVKNEITICTVTTGNSGFLGGGGGGALGYPSQRPVTTIN